MKAAVLSGKAEDLLPGVADASVDAVVCDPPYGLADHKPEVIAKALSAWLAGDRMHVPDGRGFMGQDWDRFVPPPGIWDECYRVLKPGGHMAVFAGARTQDLMGLSIRLAGFELRDGIEWVFGTGFPKNRRTQLKPAHEPIVLARKPFRGSMAANVLEYGTGALNVDGCKVGTTRDVPASLSTRPNDGQTYGKFTTGQPGDLDPNTGRWAPNVLLTHSADCVPAGTRRVATGSSGVKIGRPTVTSGIPGSTLQGSVDGSLNSVMSQGYADPDGMETVQAWSCAPGCPVAGLDAQSGTLTSGTGAVKRASAKGAAKSASIGAESRPEGMPMLCYGDTGGASRFFPQFAWDPEYDLPFLYTPKAPKRERPVADGVKPHPTVKPLAVMRWIARLLCPPGGLILDPFTGTAPVVQAALLEGFRCIAMDSWPDAIAHARVRLAAYEETGEVVFG